MPDDNATLATGLGPLPRPYPKLAPSVLDLFSLKGKVASVTGSSTGIGLAVAEAYAQAGADVCLWYNSHDATSTAERISRTYGVRAKAYKVNLLTAEGVEEAIEQQVKDFGKIDVFVANAGVPWQKGPLIDQPDDKEWQKVVELDFNAVYRCVKYAGRVFKRQGHGSLIMTASMSGHIVNYPQMQACYNAVKAAIIHLGKSLAVEWSGFARVNTISPGYIATEISDFIPRETKAIWWRATPLGREGDPRELVGAYLYFASDASTYTTGSDLRVDGGYAAP
jgi:sorbose reductase